MATRTLCRILAYQVLFSREFNNCSDIDSLLESITEYKLTDENREYIEGLVEAADRNRSEIDGILKPHIEHWSLDRMVVSDLVLLRLGVAELRFLSGEVPYKVVINECVEIAKRFGTTESGKFINGVLDKVVKSGITKGSA